MKKKIINKEKVTKMTQKALSGVANFINKNYATILTCLILAVMVCNTVYGDDPTPEGTGSTTADSLWTTLTDLVTTWVTRLGGVVMFVGGIMFGLGWKSDDAEQKSRGISTVIAGAIVAGVAAMAGTFFA
jgi:hypothetical protein